MWVRLQKMELHSGRGACQPRLGCQSCGSRVGQPPVCEKKSPLKGPISNSTCKWGIEPVVKSILLSHRHDARWVHASFSCVCMCLLVRLFFFFLKWQEFPNWSNKNVMRLNTESSKPSKTGDQWSQTTHRLFLACKGCNYKSFHSDRSLLDFSFLQTPCLGISISGLKCRHVIL